MNPDPDVALKIDEEIDAALKLFGEIQPPAALLSHVHRSLENAVEATEQTSRGWFWIPATGVAMALLLSAIYFQTHWMRGKQVRAVQTADMTMERRSLDRTMAPQALALEVSGEPKKPISARRDHHKREQYHHAVNLLSYPLTKQEKLLVRFVQTAKPEDLRDLNPEYQAKVDAQQEAEFETYLNSGTSSNKTKATNIE